MPEALTWGALRDKLRALEAPNPLLDVELDVDAGDRLASEVLLGILTARDEDELRFSNPPALRQAAARSLLDERLNGSLPELTFYLRYHHFYDGETDEVVDLIEQVHELQLRPFLGMDDPELVLFVQERLFGRRTGLDEVLDSGELQVIRLVAWATKDQVPLTLPRHLRTLEGLVEEIQSLGV